MTGSLRSARGGTVREGGWRQVASAFGEAVGLVRRHSLTFLLFFLGLILLKLSWKAVPLHQLEGWRLYLVANVVGYSLTFFRFCVLGLILALSTGWLRGRERGLPEDMLRRLGRMLPYGAALFLVWDVVGGLIGYGLFQLADRFMDAQRSVWVLDVALFAGWLPGMVAAAMFGFSLVGAAAGDRVPLGEARTLWRLEPRPLVYTLLLWYAALQTPHWATRFLVGIDMVQVIDPNWLYLVNKPFFTVLFGVVAAVWYVRLGAHHGLAGEAGA